MCYGKVGRTGFRKGYGVWSVGEMMGMEERKDRRTSCGKGLVSFAAPALLAASVMGLVFPEADIF